MPAAAQQAAWGAVPAASHAAPPVPAAWQAPSATAGAVEMPNPHGAAPPLPAPWTR
jgi:hypothetical protein